MGTGSTFEVQPSLPHFAAPHELTLPRLRSSLRAVDIDGFFTVVGQALALEMKLSEVPDGAHPVFVHTFPKERIAEEGKPFDVITWKVISAAMAPTDNAGSRIPRKPFKIPGGPDPRATSYNLLTQMWWELGTAEFTIWSKSSDTRSTLLTWFHKLLMRYANVLKFFEGRGVDMFQYVGRGEDSFETHEEQEVHFGTLTYQFRVQYLDTFSERQLEQLSVQAQIDHGDQLDISLSPEANQ
jgi:hypothetical protein